MTTRSGYRTSSTKESKTRCCINANHANGMENKKGRLMLLKKPIVPDSGLYELHKTKRDKRASSPNRGYKWFKYPSAISKRSDCVCVYKDTRTILITQSPHLHSSIPPIHSKACTLNSSPICGEACKLIPPPSSKKERQARRTR